MIYLFNNKEELIHIIKEQDLIEFTHKIEINTFDAAEFELPIEAIDKEIIEQMRFFGFFVRGTQFGVFKAYEVTMSDNYVVKGLDRAESDLRTVRIIKDKRLQSVTADQALNVALEGTGYQLGEREGLTKINKTNFYYISPREALVKIIESFNCEFRVRYEFVENKIINRYIDLYHRQGSYSGVQFEYGNNALEVTMEEDSDNVVTALIGRGKGEESTDSEGNATGGYGRRIEFTDIVWTKASGKPIDKPAGQNYIVLNDDIENKGLYQNGELKHRWGVFVDEEIEDKEVLLQATYQELLRLNNPIRKYKASILDLRDDIWLGDRVAIVKDSAKLSFEARIFSITIDKLNFDQSEVELGDYETLKSRSQSNSLNAIKEAVRELSEEQEAYNRKVQELIDNKNAEIAEKMRVMRLDMDNGIEDAKNKAEKIKQEVAAKVDETVKVASQKAKNEITQEFNAKYGDITVKMEGLQATTDELKTSDADIQKLINDFKDRTQSQFAGIQGAQSRFEQTTEKAISDLTNVANGKADRSYVEQTVAGVKEMYEDLTDLNTTNLMLGTNEPFVMGYSIPATAWIEDKKHTYLELGPVDQRKYPVEILPQKGKFYNFIPKNGVDYTQSIIVETDAEFKPEGKFQFSWYTNKGHKFDKGSIKKIGENLYRIWATTTWDKSDTTLRAFDIFHINNVLAIQSTGTYIAFSKPKLTTGKMPSDWSPAPDDQEQSISQVKSSFERTAQGLSTQLSKLEAKTAQNGELEQRMLTYSEKATAEALKSTRQILEQGYVAKAQYTEDVAGIDRKFESITTSTDSKISSKLAEYKQTVDGQFATITNQLEDTIKKTDIQITPGQIRLGVGKEISGRTISSLLVQEPEAIALIAKLIKVNGDMVVDGSILGRHIASESVETGHMKAGSVTTPILASNSVTADKVLVDSAMIDKLVSNQAFIKELMSQKAFITQLASIDFSAERISGGRILSNKGAMKIDLDNSEIDFNENARIEFKSGKNVLFRQRTHPQKKHNTIGALMFKDSVHGGVATTLGNTSHKWINEMADNPSDAGADGSFAGIRIFRDSRETPYDRVELVGDRIQFRHSVRQNGGLQFQTTGFTVPSHGEGGHAGAWNLGVLLEHFRQNFEIIRKNNPSWGLNIYGFPFYNINSDQTIPFDQYI